MCGGRRAQTAFGCGVGKNPMPETRVQDNMKPLSMHSVPKQGTGHKTKTWDQMEQKRCHRGFMYLRTEISRKTSILRLQKEQSHSYNSLRFLDVCNCMCAQRRNNVRTALMKVTAGSKDKRVFS